MIERLSNAISVLLHLAIIVLLGRVTFAVEQTATRKTGMEIEIIDLAHAMPDPSPAVAGRSEPASVPSEPQPAATPSPEQRSAPSVSEAPETPPKPVTPQPVVESPSPVPQPAPAPVPTPAPKAEAPPRAAGAQPAAEPKAKPGSAARLDAAALARSRSIGTAAPAARTRLNSATIGSAIGRAAPRGLPGLTFRQKVDLAQKVRQQVMPCWNPPAVDGAGPASVRLRFALDRQGRVVGQPVQSGVTGQTDANAAYVNLLINSGRRAILLCAPLELPPELYEAWAEVEVEFDPRDLR